MHLAWLDRVRGLAAIYVVLHHAAMHMTAAPRWTKFLFGHGHMAVDVFIVLSGFCLMLPLVGKQEFGSPVTFMLRRTVRIALPYYAAMAVSLMLIVFAIGEKSGTHWDKSIPVTWTDIGAHLLMVHQWFPRTSATINHAFWSIGVEYQIYAVFPLLFFGFRRIGPLPTTILALIVGYSAWVVSLKAGFPNPSPWGASFYYLGLFAMGALAAQGNVHGRWVATAVLGSLLLAYMVSARLIPSIQFSSAVVGCLTALYLYGRMKTPPRPRIWDAWLGRIGVVAFSLYLLHAPILQLVWVYVVEPMKVSPGGGAVLMLTLGFGASFAGAWLFYEAVEKRCHKLSRRIGRPAIRVGMETV